MNISTIAYERGVKDQRNGVPRLQNPYAMRWPSCLAWEDGWDDEERKRTNTNWCLCDPFLRKNTVVSNWRVCCKCGGRIDRKV